MKLHQLKSNSKRPPRKRVGRGDGSGNGRSCGRGDKGAGARSGHTHRAHFEGGQIPFFRRLPKRGFKNPNHVDHTVVNVSYLEDNFAAGDQVDRSALEKLGLISRSTKALKILGDGELTKSLTVKADKFSASARRKIEDAGGTCGPDAL